MPRNSHRVGALVLPLVLLMAAACSAGPSERPAVAYRDAEQQVPPAQRAPKPAPVPPLGSPGTDTLGWQDCTAQAQADVGQPMPAGLTVSCSRLLTSLDPPDAPGRGSARIAVNSIGRGAVPLVVVNDAAGEPGTAFAARLALRMPPELLNTFRIIGVDRRGTGQSEAADCVPPPEREAIVGFDPRASDRPALDRLLESVRSSSQECLLDLDDRLQAYDTWRTASDLEQLRVELGVPKLHAIGRGEGARVLSTYSVRYPVSVGRMVLDGAPDPVMDVVGQGEMQAQSAEGTFDAFAAQCTATGCPLGPDPRTAVSELVERTRTTPLPAPGAPATAGKIVHAVLNGLGDRAAWPALTRALDAANRGDGGPITALAAPLVTGTPAKPARLDADLITSCNDTTLRVPPQRSAELAREWAGKYPLFGGIFAQRLVWCGLWPVPQQQLPTPKDPALPPIPVVATASDPLTPALGSGHMADQLPSGVVLNWQGAGHGAIGRSDCITASVTRFLVSGTVPSEGTACPA